MAAAKRRSTRHELQSQARKSEVAKKSPAKLRGLGTAAKDC
jgi:hypothetical protein